MKVLLLADVKSHGKKGEIIEVNEGYARNFLIKKGFAQAATAGTINEVNQKRAAEERRIAAEQANARAIAEELKGKTFKVGARCGDGKMYGSITSQNIADALAAAGYDVDKKKIVLDAAIRELGIFEVEVKLYSGISQKIKIEVIKA